MKQTVLTVLLAAASIAANAQTTPPKPASSAASTTHKPATPSSAIKLPPGVPPVRGVLKTAFCLKYQDIKLGTGAEAEPGKVFKVHYTGWRAADGVKFDSSHDRPGPPVMDKDGKPTKDADGKPVLGPPQPMSFPQGMGRLIPGFDQGFYGMKVGGKRRLFIPWQLAYGTHNMPDRGAGHPGIPAKSDLIFDVELVDVTEPPTPPSRPGMGGPGGRPLPPGVHPGAGATPVPGKPATPTAPGTTSPAPAPSATPAPSNTTPAPSTPPAPSATPAPAAPVTPPPPTATPAPSTAPSTSTPPSSH